MNTNTCFQIINKVFSMENDAAIHNATSSPFLTKNPMFIHACVLFTQSIVTKQPKGTPNTNQIRQTEGYYGNRAIIKLATLFFFN